MCAMDHSSERTAIYIFCQRGGGLHQMFQNVQSCQLRDVHLISAKARVAALRQSTIPHLELMAALVVSRLTKTICAEFKGKTESVELWSYSKIILHWLHLDSRKHL